MRRTVVVSCRYVFTVVLGWICGFGCSGAATSGTMSSAPPMFSSAQPLALQPVAWNVNMVDLGKIAAVTELEDDVVVYGDKGATVIAGGAVTATDTRVTAWTSAATIPGADGTGAWAVGVDAAGHVWRLRARTTLEDVTDRYGLLDAKVSAVAAMGGTRAAFAIPTGIALADGATVTRFDDGAFTGLAGGSGRVAGVAADGSVHVLDGRTLKMTIYGVGDAVAAAFTVDGKLVVAAKHALWIEQGDAASPVLAALYADDTARFHGLAASAGWIWVGVDGDLVALHDNGLFRTSGLGAPAAGVLVGSTTGDAWVLDGSGALARFMSPVAGDEAVWRMAVLPVYARVCSACHDPGGTAGYPLATYAQWVALKALVYQRVIVKGDMPQGRTISDADKSAIANWSKP